MADVNDVVAYIVQRQGPMTAMKLHKLLYYSQAWHLVWDEEALFNSPIEAWAMGPVVPEIYHRHKKQLKILDWHGDAGSLAENESETIDAVLRSFGDKHAFSLSQMAHREAPWRDARGDLRPGERSNAEITLSAMHEYYSGLLYTDQ